jgi:hypothetical protein
MWTIFNAALQLIRKDHLILYPAIIAGFITTGIINYITPTPSAKKLALYFIYSWLMNLFIQLLATEFGRTLLKQKSPQFGQILKTTLLRYFPSILWTGLLLGIAGGLYVGTATTIFRWVTLPIIFFLLLWIQLFPVIFIGSQSSLIKVFGQCISFLQFRSTIFLYMLLYIILVSTLFLSLSLFCHLLPAQYADILNSLLQGILSIIISYGLLLLWEMPPKKQVIA